MDAQFSEFKKFRESDKSVNHKLGKFKDPLYYPCLASCVLTYWPLTQEVTSLSILFHKKIVAEFSKNT